MVWVWFLESDGPGSEVYYLCDLGQLPYRLCVQVPACKMRQCSERGHAAGSSNWQTLCVFYVLVSSFMLLPERQAPEALPSFSFCEEWSLFSFFSPVCS